MLPSNIDLTERADFGRHSLTFNLIDLDDLDATNNMSIDKYDSLIRLEGIFGRKRYINQKWEIFPRIGLNVEDPHVLCCARCGKVIRIPWKNYELCFECNDKVETETWGKIPWNRNMNNFSSRNDERGYNLFNSK